MNARRVTNTKNCVAMHQANEDLVERRSCNLATTRFSAKVSPLGRDAPKPSPPSATAHQSGSWAPGMPTLGLGNSVDLCVNKKNCCFSLVSFDVLLFLTRACLKKCIQNQLPALEEAGCTLGLLQKSLAGKICNYDNPENCAVCESERVCVTRDGTNTGVSCTNRGDCVESAGFTGTCEKRGQCKCGPSSRCVICSAGTHFRNQGP